MKVLMVVNNPGSHDVRVVKSAEAIVQRGGECVVIGIHEDGFLENEIINGVLYHRIKLKLGYKTTVAAVLRSVIASDNRFAEDVFETSKQIKSIPSQRSADKNKDNSNLSMGDKNKNIRREKTYSELIREMMTELSAFARTICYFSNSKLRRLGSIVTRQLTGPLGVIHTFAIFHRQGSYLRAFYPVVSNSTADIIHCHEIWPLEACALAKRGRPLVYDAHELELHRYSPWPNRSKVLVANYERRYIGDVDKVIAVSKGCGDEMAQEYRLHDYLLLRNMPKRSMQQKSPESLRDLIAVNQHIKLLVYTGNLTYNRGVDEIVGALVRLPDRFHLVCVGNRRAEVFGAVKKRAKELDVWSRLHFVDAVPPSVVIDLISDGDFAMIPIKNACLSYYHCLPNKLFEGMHAGLPILASNFPDMSEVVLEENIGLVDPMTDSASIAAKILELEEKARSFYAHGKLNSLRKRYEFDSDFDAVYDYYQFAIAEGRGLASHKVINKDARKLGKGGFARRKHLGKELTGG